MERAVASAIAWCRRRNPETAALYAKSGKKLSPRPVMVTPWSVCTMGAGIKPPLSRSQLNSAVRAMHTFVDKFPQYGLVSAKGGRGRLALYERGDELSAMWAKLNSQRDATLTAAEAALEHLKSRRNEPFVVQRQRRVAFRITATGREDTRRRKQFFDITLPTEAEAR
jgi:hypothetical protein